MTLTPNISIYMPGDGEQDWGQSFNSGLLNIDQHDHSGLPNKGLPISGAGIAVGSITPDKFSSTVFGTGIVPDTAPATLGGISVDGALRSFYTVSKTNVGIPAVIAAPAGTVVMRSIVGADNQIDVTNPNGVAGNPTISINRDSQLSPTTGNVVIAPTNGTVSILSSSSGGNLNLESSSGDILINARTATKTIIFQLGSVNLARFINPTTPEGSRAAMLSLDSAKETGISTFESFVTVAVGAPGVIIKSSISNKSMWLINACSVGSNAYVSGIFYGADSGTDIKTFLSANCTLTLTGGSNITLTNNLAGAVNFRVTGLRLY